MTEAPFKLRSPVWEISTLGEVAARGGGNVQTGPFGSQLHASDYVAEGVPSVMPQNIGDNRIVEAGIARITEQDAQRLAKHRLIPGDIVYSRRGDVERRALVRKENAGWLCGTGCLRVRLGEGHLIPEYAAYYLGHPLVRQWVVQHAVGATMPNLNTGILSALPVVVPPLDDQAAIADALTSLDDKIELNRRMNETLEAMARAIFRDWFVDFGPVRRKMEGATDPVAIMGGLTPDPAREAELARLFPAALDEDGRPTGWGESTLGEKTVAVLGGTPSRKVAEYWDGSIPWINSGAVNEFRITEPSELITEQGLAKSAAKLLPRRTTVLAITGATLGQVSLTEIETSANQSVVGLVHRGGLPPEFVYLWVKEVIDEIVARQTGGAQQHINKGNVEEQRVLTPPDDVLRAWSELAVPLFDLIASGCFENRTLAEIRDYLLPRLMSGAVRVGDAQSQDAAA